VVAGSIFHGKIHKTGGLMGAVVLSSSIHPQIILAMKTLHHAASISILAFVITAPALFAKQDSLIISVHSQASSSYKRTLLPDGNIKPQTYVVGNGGIAGLPAGAVDNVAFPTIVRLLAPKLVQQSYYPARKGMTADLLLVLSWGETTPFNDAPLQNANANLSSAMNMRTAAEMGVKESIGRGEEQRSSDGIQSVTRTVRDVAADAAESQLFQAQLFEQMRMQSNEGNARLLGYVQEINRRNNPSRFAGGGDYFNELMSDIETPRYYVIVQAYDFQTAVNEKRRKLLWTTRISIPVSGSDFNKCLPAMMADASEYFGRNSGRLVRRYRTGVVRLGELQVVGVEPGASSAESKPESAN
jgi:hypothetical protein